MLARVFTLHFDPVVEGFDDVPLRDFLKDKTVLSLRDHFFVRHEIPYLTVVVTYQLSRPDSIPLPPASRTPQEGAWREMISAADLPLFNAVRDWRAERSKHFQRASSLQRASSSRAQPP